MNVWCAGLDKTAEWLCALAYVLVLKRLGALVYVPVLKRLVALPYVLVLKRLGH